MTVEFGRRAFLTGLSALALVAALPRGALALSAQTAETLVRKLVSEIYTVINSGKPEAAMYADFGKIFVRYADMNAVISYCLGPDGRRATAAQRKAFTAAFIGYVSRKYGSKFHEFAGGSITVKQTRPINDGRYEVTAIADLKGQTPYDVVFLVSDKSGKPLFYEMLVEGVSMLRSERTEIGAMIDRRKGDLDAMIADLAKAG